MKSIGQRSRKELNEWRDRMHKQENRRKLFIGVFNPGTFSDDYWRRALDHRRVHQLMHGITWVLDKYNGTGFLAQAVLEGYEVYLDGGDTTESWSAFGESAASNAASSYVGGQVGQWAGDQIFDAIPYF